MTFNANRDIRTQASAGASGLFTLRTQGLDKQKRPELELQGVPEGSLHAAGTLVNIVADYTVNRAEVFDGQRMGHELAVSEDSSLLLVVLASALEKPQAGFFAKLVGANKGVLRLIEPTADEPSPPLTALATMHIHRAKVRREKDDVNGARQELAAAIATFAGVTDAGPAPQFSSAGAYNWQNHLAYLELADIERADVATAAKHYANALARSEELTYAETGSPLAAFAALDQADVRREAQCIVDHNLATPRVNPVNAMMVEMGSPIWERGENDTVTRRAALMPAALVALYYEGIAADALRASGAELVAKLFARASPERMMWIARPMRPIWITESAPWFAPHGPWHTAHGVVSTVLTDVARCFHAGANEAEIIARYDGTPSALDTKLATLAAREGEIYVQAMGSFGEG